MSVLKNKYNQLLERHQRAAEYMQNPSVELHRKETWVPEYREIVRELGELLKQIGDYSDDEVLNGFQKGGR